MHALKHNSEKTQYEFCMEGAGLTTRVETAREIGVSVTAPVP
jgi:hypothetical protein